MRLIQRFKAWLRRSFSQKPPGIVFVDRDGFRYVSTGGDEAAMSWSDLRLVGVETNAGGPFVEDVYFYVEGPEFGVHIPQGATGTNELTHRLFELPGFDSGSFIEAMCSTGNARFVCWRRDQGVSPLPPTDASDASWPGTPD